jgi:hypothetical protein
LVNRKVPETHGGMQPHTPKRGAPKLNIRLFRLVSSRLLRGDLWRRSSSNDDSIDRGVTTAAEQQHSSNGGDSTGGVPADGTKGTAAGNERQPQPVASRMFRMSTSWVATGTVSSRHLVSPL